VPTEVLSRKEASGSEVGINGALHYADDFDIKFLSDPPVAVVHVWVQHLMTVVEEEFMAVVESNPRGRADFIDIKGRSGSWRFFCQNGRLRHTGLASLLSRAIRTDSASWHGISLSSQMVRGWMCQLPLTAGRSEMATSSRPDQEVFGR